MEKSKKEVVGTEFIKNEKVLLSYAIYLTGDINEAKDLLQEVALHSLIKAEKYTDNGLFVAWAREMMKNKFLNQEKSKRRRSTMNYDDIPMNETPLSVAESDSDAGYGSIKRIIETLPATQSSTLLLVAEGWSYRDICEKTELSMSDVRNHIHAARVKMRKKLKDL